MPAGNVRQLTIAGLLLVICSYSCGAQGASGPLTASASRSSSPAREIAAPITPSPNTLQELGTIIEYSLPAGSGDPEIITAGPDGNLWVTGRNIIAKVTTAGSFTNYSIPTPGGTPVAITAGPGGNLWFLEPTGGKVAKVTTTGSFTEYTIPIPGCPDHMAAGSDGNLWFTVSCGANKLLRVTTTGSFTQFDIPSADSWPGGITAGPDGNLWFTEQNTNKVAKVTTSGRFTEYTLPSAGGAPLAITAGPDGNLWFTELSGNKVAKVTTSGSITEYTLPSPGAPNLGEGPTPPGNAPTAITAGPDGNLWVTEQYPNKVARVTTRGIFTEYAIPTGIQLSKSLPPTSCPHAITTGPDNQIWFTESCADKIGKLIAVEGQR